MIVDIIRSSIFTIIWLFTIFLWVLVVACLPVAVYTSVWGAIPALIFFGGLAIWVTCIGLSWNSLPSMFWRYRKVHETRIVQIGNSKKYMMQVKVLGCWYAVDASSSREVTLMLFEKFSCLHCICSSLNAIEQHEKNFHAFITRHHNEKQMTMKEVISRHRYVKGVRS